VRGAASGGGVQKTARLPAGNAATCVETIVRRRWVCSTRKTTRAASVSVKAMRAVSPRCGLSVVSIGPSPANGCPPFDARKSSSLGAPVSRPAGIE
jgi:hypothetical protein